jgi:hypothetical protein
MRASGVCEGVHIRSRGLSLTPFRCVRVAALSTASCLGARDPISAGDVHQGIAPLPALHILRPPRVGRQLRQPTLFRHMWSGLQMAPMPTAR